MDKKRILFIEDEPDQIMVVQTRLEASDFEVITAALGEEGLRKAREDKPDLILLDLILPDISGFDVCKSLKEDPETKDIPVIIITAFGTPVAEEDALDYGADGFIKKPYDSADLVVKIKELLRGEEISISKKKILLIYNEPQFFKMTKMRLEVNNYDVITASNREDVSDKVVREKPDAVLLDILMPELNGLSGLERIKIENKDLPVFIITAFSNEERFRLAKKIDTLCLLLRQLI